MTVILEDLFNRTAADLTTSPSGRWGAPAGSGGTNAWAADGQFARTATTFAASSRGLLRWTGQDHGKNWGEFRARFIRTSSTVQEVGIFLRAQRSGTDYRRYGLVYASSANRWELRYYSSLTAYLVLTSATNVATGFTWDGNPHTLRYRVRPQPCTNPNNAAACPNPGTTLVHETWIDGTYLGWLVSTDHFVPLGLANYRGFGFEVLTAAGWNGATDVLRFDDAQWDDLTPDAPEELPAFSAPITYTAVSIAGEGTAADPLPFTPDIGEQVDMRFHTIGTEMDAPYEHTWAQFQEGRRLWRVGHSALSTADAETLRVFLLAHIETPMLYTCDDGVTRSGTWVGGALKITQWDPAFARMEYVIEEAL